MAMTKETDISPKDRTPSLGEIDDELRRLAVLFGTGIPTLLLTESTTQPGQANQDAWAIRLSRLLLVMPDDAWKLVLAHEFGHLIDRKTPRLDRIAEFLSYASAGSTAGWGAWMLASPGTPSWWSIAAMTGLAAGMLPSLFFATRWYRIVYVETRAEAAVPAAGHDPARALAFREGRIRSIRPGGVLRRRDEAHLDRLARIRKVAQPALSS